MTTMKMTTMKMMMRLRRLRMRVMTMTTTEKILRNPRNEQQLLTTRRHTRRMRKSASNTEKHSSQSPRFLERRWNPSQKPLKRRGNLFQKSLARKSKPANQTLPPPLQTPRSRVGRTESTSRQRPQPQQQDKRPMPLEKTLKKTLPVSRSQKTRNKPSQNPALSQKEDQKERMATESRIKVWGRMDGVGRGAWCVSSWHVLNQCMYGGGGGDGIVLTATNVLLSS